MAWRTVVITKNGHLRCKNKQLVWEDEEGSVELPLEDLAVVVLESHRVNLTVPVLSELAQAGACLVVCDERHQPVGMLLPLEQHSRGVEVLEVQVNASLPLRKRCWQRVIRQKIANQAQALRDCGVSDGSEVQKYEAKVQSGDTTNIEAQAAREYWKALFGKSFGRNALNIRNSALNYGYAIVRSAVARAVVAYGLQPGLGMCHANKLNNYNLADDLFEPFRPYVDRVVFRAVNDELTELGPQLKQELLASLDFDVDIEGENQTLLRATETVAMTYVTALKLKSPEALHLPQMRAQ